jgi:hypothetical protein
MACIFVSKCITVGAFSTASLWSAQLCGNFPKNEISSASKCMHCVSTGHCSHTSSHCVSAGDCPHTSSHCVSAGDCPHTSSHWVSAGDCSHTSSRWVSAGDCPHTSSHWVSAGDCSHTSSHCVSAGDCPHTSSHCVSAGDCPHTSSHCVLRVVFPQRWNVITALIARHKHFACPRSLLPVTSSCPVRLANCFTNSRGPSRYGAVLAGRHVTHFKNTDRVVS